jgi:hypothetical protein
MRSSRMTPVAPRKRSRAPALRVADIGGYRIASLRRARRGSAHSLVIAFSTGVFATPYAVRLCAHTEVDGRSRHNRRDGAEAGDRTPGRPQWEARSHALRRLNDDSNRMRTQTHQSHQHVVAVEAA